MLCTGAMNFTRITNNYMIVLNKLAGVRAEDSEITVRNNVIANNCNIYNINLYY